MFAGELPLCEEKGCAYVPPEDMRLKEPYRGLVKPDIVFFGEGLPDRFAKYVMEVIIQYTCRLTTTIYIRFQMLLSVANCVFSHDLQSKETQRVSMCCNS